MQRKLTLRLEDELIAAAKAQAARVGKSLSQMVADYFEAITKARREPVEMTPTVAKLRGSWKAANVDERDYYAHLEEKHLERKEPSAE